MLSLFLAPLQCSAFPLLNLLANEYALASRTYVRPPAGYFEFLDSRTTTRALLALPAKDISEAEITASPTFGINVIPIR